VASTLTRFDQTESFAGVAVRAAAFTAMVCGAMRGHVTLAPTAPFSCTQGRRRQSVCVARNRSRSSNVFT
jgi:hypothetical protein